MLISNPLINLSNTLDGVRQANQERRNTSSTERDNSATQEYIPASLDSEQIASRLVDSSGAINREKIDLRVLNSAAISFRGQRALDIYQVSVDATNRSLASLGLDIEV